MTKSQADRLARVYRSMAGKCFQHLINGKAAESGCEDYIRHAHEALGNAFRAIEEKNGVY